MSNPKIDITPKEKEASFQCLLFISSKTKEKLEIAKRVIKSIEEFVMEHEN